MTFNHSAQTSLYHSPQINTDTFTKCLTFCKPHFHKHFLKGKCCILLSISPMFVPDKTYMHHHAYIFQQSPLTKMGVKSYTIMLQILLKNIYSNNVHIFENLWLPSLKFLFIFRYHVLCNIVLHYCSHDTRERICGMLIVLTEMSYECCGISNHQQFKLLFNGLFRLLRIKEASKLHITSHVSTSYPCIPFI